MALDFATFAQQTYEKYGQVIANMLGVPLRTDLTFTLENQAFMDANTEKPGTALGLAFQDGHVAVLDTYWESNPQNAGELIHEMTHEMQGAAGGQKQVEAIADAVRYIAQAVMGETETEKGWSLSPQSAKWVNLFRHNYEVFADTAASMSDGTYKPGDLETALHDTPKKDVSTYAADAQATPPSSGAQPSGVQPMQVVNVPGYTTQGGGYSDQTGGYDSTHDARIITPVYSGTDDQGGGGGKTDPNNPYGDMPGDGKGDGKGDGGKTPAEKASARAARRAEHQRELNARATYVNQMSMYGIDITPDVRDIIQEAAQKGWGADRFMAALRDTAEYKDRFPGIFDDQGHLQMTEAQYLQTEQSYQAIGEKAGLNIGPKLTAWLFKNDVSAAEFQDRAAAIRQIKTNPDLYNQFGKALVQAGVVNSAKDVTKQEMLKFVLNEKNHEWYDVWNLANARYAATQAGIHLVKGTDQYLALNPGLIAKLADKGLSPEGLSQGFDQLSQLMLEVLPEAGIAGYNNLNKKALVQGVFGGKKKAMVIEKIKHIQAEAEAADQATAAPQSYADAGGNKGLVGYGGEKASAD